MSGFRPPFGSVARSDCPRTGAKPLVIYCGLPDGRASRGRGRSGSGPRDDLSPDSLHPSPDRLIFAGVYFIWNALHAFPNLFIVCEQTAD